MKLRLFPLLSLLVAVSLLVQVAPLPAAARIEPGSTIPAAPTAFSCDAVTELPKTECEALVALYNSTNGPGWTNRTGWLVTDTPCGWSGITCSQGHVQRLGLRLNNLQESIPPQLGNLANLQTLDLSDNQLTGAIPPQLGNLTNLRWLSLGHNQLTGTIPAELGNLTNLEWLNLWWNQLTGSIPPQLVQNQATFSAMVRCDS